MNLKVGDKVKLNKEIKNFKYGRSTVSYDEIGVIKDMGPSRILVNFPSHHYWLGLIQELVSVSKEKHFKSLPNNYTGTIEIENGFILEKKVLDEAEKRYLKGVIRPFKNRISHISKECNDGDCYISVDLDDEFFDLPYFKKGTMYKGMEEEKRYTLKELGLDE